MNRFILGLCLVIVHDAFCQVRTDVFIPVGTSDSLDAMYFKPNQLPPPSGYPTLMFIHGFGTDKYSQAASCSVYAANGYFTMTYSVRGHGNSSGLSTIMSTQERHDFADALEYLKHLPAVDSASVGVIGSSQGGLHALWAAADHLAVKAIADDVIIPGWASDLFTNGCFRRTLTLLLRTNTVHYAPTRDTLWDLLRNDQYDSLKAQFSANRDLDTSILNSSDVPSLTLLKWQDHYFSPSNGIESFLRYSGTKKLYLGTQGHFSDEVYSEQYYQSDQLFRWFGYFLKNSPTGILNEPLITYAYSSLPMDSLGFYQWTRVGVSSWPPQGIQPVRFYLGPDSALLTHHSDAEDFSFQLQNRYLNPSYTIDTSFIEGFHGSRIDLWLPKQTFIFNSPPLESDMYWVGVPVMKFYVSSNDANFPIHAQIYELDSLGNKYFVNRINYTARHWQVGSGNWIAVNGIPHAHKFRRGDRIRVEVTNIDRTNRIDIGNYPFVVPMFANASVTIQANEHASSYIEIPFVTQPTSVLHDIEVIPNAIVLDQNYPNPFNPSTMIRYSIPAMMDVKLTVYDILGREVQTLVNGSEAPGSHFAVWNGAGAASGLYFYKLVVHDGMHAYGETSVSVKKMLLLR